MSVHVRPNSMVVIVSGVVSKIGSGDFVPEDSKNGQSISWRKIEVAILGGKVGVSPTAEQWNRVAFQFKEGDQIQAVGGVLHGEKLTRIVSIKNAAGVELLDNEAPENAVAGHVLDDARSRASAAPPRRAAA